MIRSIHLNPLRTKVVSDIWSVTNTITARSVLAGKKKQEWRDTGYMLSYFGEKAGEARRRYIASVKQGFNTGDIILIVPLSHADLLPPGKQGGCDNCRILRQGSGEIAE